jgi:hypothetical protein
MDVLMDRDGKVTALIVGVGGFLGLGEKDVAVPFNAVQPTSKLRRASKYDRNAMTWVSLCTYMFFKQRPRANNSSYTRTTSAISIHP